MQTIMLLIIDIIIRLSSINIIDDDINDDSDDLCVTENQTNDIIIDIIQTMVMTMTVLMVFNV